MACIYAALAPEDMACIYAAQFWSVQMFGAL